jgi:hypothetical protein
MKKFSKRQAKNTAQIRINKINGRYQIVLTEEKNKNGEMFLKDLKKF